MLNRPGVEPQILTEIATLGSIAAATGRARTSHEVAAYALEILRRSSAADTGVVLFDDGDGLDVEAAYGFPDGAVEAILNDTSMSPQLLASMERATAPMYAPVASAAMRPDVARQLSEAGITHVLIAPLRTAGRVAGLMGLGWRGEPAVAPPEATLLHATVVIGPSLENAHLVERLQRSLAAERRLADEQATLQSLTLIAEKAGAFEELAATTIGQIVPLVDAAAGSYALIDGEELAHTAWTGVPDSFIDRVRGVAASTMTPVRRLRSGEGAFVQFFVEGGAQPQNLASAREQGFTAYGAVPVRVEDRLEALMMLWFRRPLTAPNETSELERVLDGVGRIAGISLANFRLRERLLASESRYRLLFEESPDAILLLKPTGEVIDANPAALRLYRTDLAALQGFAASGKTRMSAEERKRRVETIKKEGRGIFRDVGVRPDGTEFPEEVAVVRIDIGGETRKLLIVRDLTEQTRLQQELLQAQKMEAIGQLVSGVAHELNNPLAAIVAFSQLIRTDTRLPVDLRDDAEILVQEADRTRRIVQNLLDFARQRPPERHPTSLDALVASVLALQSYSLQAGRIDLAIDVPTDLPLIDVDRSQLQQVLLNLTLNAIQAIRAVRPEGRIWITAREVARLGGAPWVRLEVSDDGPGIPEDNRPRLFLPFFTTKKPGEGTGLGLSVSFGIVAAHGGQLRFEPRRAGGATFVVELPVTSRAAPERRQGVTMGGARDVGAPRPRVVGRAGSARGVASRNRTAVSSGSDTATGRSTGSSPIGESAGRAERDRSGLPTPVVLVVDDEPAIRAFLTKSLRRIGLEARTVSQGEDAVALTRTQRFACVLVDQRMPGMSGAEVYDAITGIRPELSRRFVLMSGDVLNAELRTFANDRGITLLAKPFDVETVDRLVIEIVERESPDRVGAAGGVAADGAGAAHERDTSAATDQRG
jgi:PAS domain S-box-containing protein